MSNVKNVQMKLIFCSERDTVVHVAMVRVLLRENHAGKVVTFNVKTNLLSVMKRNFVSSDICLTYHMESANIPPV